VTIVTILVSARFATRRVNPTSFKPLKITSSEAQALGVLREALARLDESDGKLRAAVELVPSSTRHHLQRLARTVPVEYSDGAH